MMDIRLTGSDPGGVLSLLEEAGDTAHGELESCLGTPGDGLLPSRLAASGCGLSCHDDVDV
jgi:hypothetical protein